MGNVTVLEMVWKIVIVITEERRDRFAFAAIFGNTGSTFATVGLSANLNSVDRLSDTSPHVDLWTYDKPHPRVAESLHGGRLERHIELSLNISQALYDLPMLRKSEWIFAPPLRCPTTFDRALSVIRLICSIRNLATRYILNRQLDITVDYTSELI